MPKQDNIANLTAGKIGQLNCIVIRFGGRSNIIMNLKEVVEAYKKGELNKETDILILDNDGSSLYKEDGSDEPECVYGEHPEKILREALEILGIPYGYC